MLSQTAEHALRALLYLAQRGGMPVAAEVVAAAIDAPPNYLSKTLHVLSKQGIVAGTRGPRGGYRLARERRRVSVGDVVRVVRGIEEMPAQEDLASSSRLGRKVIGPFWAATEHELMARLDRVSIEDLCRRAEEQGVVSETQRAVDYAM